jgi:hypothetical protein
MTEHLSSPRISRRSLLRGGAAAALAAGLPPSACAAWMPPARGGRLLGTSRIQLSRILFGPPWEHDNR